ncbi:MAG: Rid family hydrolase, partial [Chloroflexota bacterium]
AAIGARRSLLGAGFPSPTGVAMPRVAGAGNLLSVDAVCVMGDDSRGKVLHPAGGPSGDVLSPSGVTKGGFLFTCRTTAARRDVGTGQVVCTGTLAQQMELIYDSMGQVLKAANASFDDIVMTTEFVTTTEGYRETSDVRRRLFKNGFPAATGVICGGLGQPNALIALEAVVVLDRDAARQIINPGWPHYERYTFCPGIRRGDYLFISGATATETDASGKVVVRGGVAVQAQLIYDRARAIVEAAGGAMKDIVHVTEYVTLLHAYDTVGAVRGQVFGDAGPVGTGHGPAVSTVVVKGLLRPDALIEIDAVAVLG